MTKPKIEKIAKQLTPLFQEARKTNELFQKEWNKNFPKMDQAYKQTLLYKTTLAEMQTAQQRIDQKILPVVDELKNGITTNIDTALGYLAVSDRYFRSGYTKEIICKSLARLELSTQQKALLVTIWESTNTYLGAREKKQFLKLLDALNTNL